MSVEKGLLYAKSHEWVKEEGGEFVVGITDYAQSELGDLVFVNLPEENSIFSFLPHKSISAAAIPSIKSDTQSNELHAYTGIKSVTSLPASASSLEME